MTDVVTKAHLIEAANRVAEDPSDARICDLLEVAFNLPFSEMPRAYLDSPLGLTTNGSVGQQLRAMEPDQLRSHILDAALGRDSEAR